jgi:hypothetical protein
MPKFDVVLLEKLLPFVVLFSNSCTSIKVLSCCQFFICYFSMKVKCKNIVKCNFNLLKY